MNFDLYITIYFMHSTMRFRENKKCIRIAVERSIKVEKKIFLLNVMLVDIL